MNAQGHKEDMSTYAADPHRKGSEDLHCSLDGAARARTKSPEAFLKFLSIVWSGPCSKNPVPVYSVSSPTCSSDLKPDCPCWPRGSTIL